MKYVQCRTALVEAGKLWPEPARVKVGYRVQLEGVHKKSTFFV